MNLAKRAIIMAAGKGTRMAPLTDRIPKPLVPVHGQPMIESIIDALHANHIEEIYVVTGYLKEHFSYLPEKYPGITLLKNPDFDTANNISSLYYAREHLEDVIILDGDQIVLDNTILNPAFPRSGYCAIFSQGHTDEWLLTVKDDLITHCSRTGGENGWALHSVSFWTKEDGARLRKHLEADYPARSDIYWDDLAIFCHPEEYQLGIRPITANQLLELDSLADLAAVDSHYASEVR